MEEETKTCDNCETCATACTMHEGGESTTEETPITEPTA